MNYWWVNQNQTYKEEVSGGYMWSPKTKKEGRRNPSYDFMKEILPGDVIFSFCNTKIKAVGFCRRGYSESPKPTEFGDTGQNWSILGWKVDVDYFEFLSPIRPKDHISILKPFLPTKYSPLSYTGDGFQWMYLTKLTIDFANKLIEIIGSDYNNAFNQLKSVFDDEITEKEIDSDISIPETDKIELKKSRRGQGIFKVKLKNYEKKCRFTGVDIEEFLEASHIKPWGKSNNQERLDGNNGLLLAPHIHHLFDKGYLYYDGYEKFIVSQKLPKKIKDCWKIPDEFFVGKFNSKQFEYLQFHREFHRDKHEY